MSEKPIGLRRGFTVDRWDFDRCTIQISRDGDADRVEMIIRLGKDTAVNFPLLGNEARNLGEALIGIAPPDTRKKIPAAEVTCIDRGKE